MKITVIYGGRGLIEDPTLYVLEKLQMVFEELRVQVERINLYEEKSRITTLPARLKDADGLVLGVSLEWFGIGGYMQEFLDACWLYADKEKLKSVYMMPAVVSTANGEKDAMLYLQKAWEVLGGQLSEGLCAYVEDMVDFELDKEYSRLIEAKAEQLYRTVNQKRRALPSSTMVLSNKVLKPKSIDLTPQESEQLSKFVSNDTYVRQQKEDIEELAAMFKGMLQEQDSQNESESADEAPFTKESEEQVGKRAQTQVGAQTQVQVGAQTRRQAENKPRMQTIPGNFEDRFRRSFHPEDGFSATYILTITDKDEMLQIAVQLDQLHITHAQREEGDVIIRVSSGVLNRITMGDMTFQKAFMSGEMKIKGNFKTLRMLDQIFRFV